MAFQIYKNGDNTSSKVIELVADTEDDIENLPTDCAAGSTCILTRTSEVYIFGVDGVWRKL